MKTIIDREQAERLKEVCEKYGVKLPESKYYLDMLREDCGFEFLDPHPDHNYTLSLTELLDWLPKEITGEDDNEYWFTMSIYPDCLNEMDGDNIGSASYFEWSEFETYIEFDSAELTDALFELFIWTIENGYYKGV